MLVHTSDIPLRIHEFVLDELGNVVHSLAKANPLIIVLCLFKNLDSFPCHRAKVLDHQTRLHSHAIFLIVGQFEKLFCFQTIVTTMTFGNFSEDQASGVTLGNKCTTGRSKWKVLACIHTLHSGKINRILGLRIAKPVEDLSVDNDVPFGPEKLFSLFHCVHSVWAKKFREECHEEDLKIGGIRKHE